MGLNSNLKKKHTQNLLSVHLWSRSQEQKQATVEWQQCGDGSTTMIGDMDGGGATWVEL